MPGFPGRSRIMGAMLVLGLLIVAVPTAPAGAVPVLTTVSCAYAKAHAHGDLSYTSITGCNFANTDFSDTNFSWAALTGNNFTGDNLDSTKWFKTTSTGNNYTGASFHLATDFSGGNGAIPSNYFGATFTGDNFTNAQLGGSLGCNGVGPATFCDGVGGAAVLMYATFAGDNFTGANLSGPAPTVGVAPSVTGGANVDNSEFSSTNFNGANVNGAHDCGSNLDPAFKDANTPSNNMSWIGHWGLCA